MKYPLAQVGNAAGVVSPWKNCSVPQENQSIFFRVLTAPANIPVEVLIELRSQPLNIFDKKLLRGRCSLYTPIDPLPLVLEPTQRNGI